MISTQNKIFFKKSTLGKNEFLKTGLGSDKEYNSCQYGFKSLAGLAQYYILARGGFDLT